MKRFLKFILLLFICAGAAAVFHMKTPVQIKEDVIGALQDLSDQKLSESLNSQPITLKKDGERLTFSNLKNPYVTKDMKVMIPADMFALLFGGTAAQTSEGCYTFELGGHELTVQNSSDDYTVDGIKKSVKNPVIERKGNYYVDMDLLVSVFGGSYEWDPDSSTLSVTSKTQSEAALPSSYDLRLQGKMTPVRDQGDYGTCWAFAALSALESCLLPEQFYTFSPDHMNYFSGYDLSHEEGGDFNMSLAYLAAWRGPVSEIEDPYGDGEVNEEAETLVHLQEAVVVPAKDIEAVKEAVYKYGGVQTAIYSDMEFVNDSSSYYDVENASYYYPGVNLPNHEVVIVGWDDYYDRANFNVYPEEDGAFLCRNSWGEAFGVNGYFYISYEDTNVAADNMVYTRVEDNDNYDHIYQSDLLGCVGTMGYGEDTAWFSSVYTAQSDEELKAVSFYTTDRDSYYDIFIVRDFTDSASFDTMEYVKSGWLDEAGYYTSDFLQEIELDEGERFAVVVRMTTKKSERPVAIEYNMGELTSTVDISDGESYISYDGKTWENLEESYDANACLKAFTNAKR